tara:strand:+ start:152145 stop:152465 length:321 start_codon:yes stop_codon:yes gene_type:complete
MNHKSAWAEEEKAPYESYSDERSPRRRIVASKPSVEKKVSSNLPQDILIVVSKMKNYIKAKSDMNTSADVADKLSDVVRAFCDEAIEEAQKEGRKTVMGRDFKKPY